MTGESQFLKLTLSDVQKNLNLNDWQKLPIILRGYINEVASEKDKTEVFALVHTNIHCSGHRNTVDDPLPNRNPTDLKDLEEPHAGLLN
jgi:hypothetical protein